MTRSGKIDPAISQKLAREIREIAKRAHNEEEVRLPVESALKPVLAQLGISTQVSCEPKLTTLQSTGYHYVYTLQSGSHPHQIYTGQPGKAPFQN